MADIKAKDISVAQSIASNDLILGSSIAGTTANVTVETLENHATNIKTYSSINNKTISAAINDLFGIFSSMSNIQTVGGTFTSTLSNAWEYTNYSLRVPNNHIYAVWGEAVYQNNAPIGCALSVYPNMKGFVSVAESPNVGADYFVQRSPIAIVSNTTLYLYEKRDHSGQNQSYIKYIDLFTI